MSLEQAFATVLKRYRAKSRLTQLQLAEKSDFDVSYISLLERGKRQPSLKTLIRLADALGVSAVQLFSSTLKELDKRE